VEDAKTSLVFHENHSATEPSHRTLDIFLRIEASEDHALWWTSEVPTCVRVNLKQNPPPPPVTTGVGSAGSITSGEAAFHVPAGSTLEWNLNYFNKGWDLPDGVPLDHFTADVDVSGRPWTWRMGAMADEKPNQFLFKIAPVPVTLKTEQSSLPLKSSGLSGLIWLPDEESPSVCLAGARFHLPPLIAANKQAIVVPHGMTAALRFKDVSRDDGGGQPRLKVILQLTYDSDSTFTSWASSEACLEPEILDPRGKLLPESAPATEASSEGINYYLPNHSLLEWRVSDPKASPQPAADHSSYLVAIAGHSWMIPVDTASLHSLRLKVHGEQWEVSTSRPRPYRVAPVLFDVPATPLIVEKAE